MAQGWNVTGTTTDLITFWEAPPLGVNNIVVDQYDKATRNTTDAWALAAWSAENGYPWEVEFFGDRLIFARTAFQPQTVWMSQAGNYSSFGRSQPIEDSDRITATLLARQVNAIQDLIPLDSLILLTTGGEWRTRTGDEDVLSPTTVGFKPQSYYGASAVPSIVIGDTALYVQDRGYIVRDISYSFEADGYKGSDITVFSNHLLLGKPVQEWAYQQVPYSIVWVAREDGGLLALTYMREQEVIGWTPMEVDGFVESVCTLPEGGEDVLYAIIRREVDGAQVRYVERLSSRLFDAAVDDIRDATFLDSFLTYDGRSDGSVSLYISNIGAGGWTNTDQVSVTANLGAAAIFSAADIGDKLFVRYDGGELRLEIVGYTTPSAITCIPHMTVPAELRSVDLYDWVFARNVISGLEHLEGRTVGILADGLVHRQLEVTGGQITLDDPRGVVHVGLPYNADFETLDVVLPSAESVRLRNKTFKRLGLIVQDTRGLQAGRDADHLQTIAGRTPEDAYGVPGLLQDTVEVWVSGNWHKNGRVFVRQSDPLPVSILGVIPEWEFGE
jgi:hypothetical protein